jgi:thioredoxin reductase (NADPH)
LSQTPDSPSLSEAQLVTLGEFGEERTATAGDVLYRVGDRDYPFVAIIEGEVAILDAAGNEIARHGASKFLGEVNLLSGQGLFVTAVAIGPLRYIAVEREALRSLLFDDGPLTDLLLATFIARREAMQQVGDLGLEILGPRSSPATLRLLEFVRSNRLPLTWRDPERGADPDAAALLAGLDGSSLPLVRLPGGLRCKRHPSGSSPAHWESGVSWRRKRTSICSSSAPDQPASAPPSTGHQRVSTR